MADFKKPWADWTPEIADAVRTKLEARAFNSQEETQAALRALEGYWAEHDMERTLEQNAPTFSAYGLKRNVRALFPKTMEAVEAKRPWWMTAFQVPRDIITSPQRAGIQVAGDIKNAGIATSNALFGTGFQMIDPSTYTMAGTDRLRSDPGVALMAFPQGRPMQLVRALSEKGAETAARVASKAPSWVEKGARAAGGFGGEAFGVAGIESASNLGEVSPEEAAGVGLAGTTLGRLFGLAPAAIGKGIQEGTKYLTRQKYNIAPGYGRKVDLHKRKFTPEGGKVKSDELLMLESGNLGRDPDVTEAITGEGSVWKENIGKAYKKFSADQNARVEDALALTPQVSAGKPLPANGERVIVKGSDLPKVQDTGTFQEQASAFRRELEAAGVRPSEMIVREGETTQQALAREMNGVDAYLERVDKEIERILRMLETEQNPAKRAALEERGTAMAQMRDEIADHLERAGALAEKMGLGIVGRERYANALAKELASQVEATGDYSKSVLSDKGEKQALKIGDQLISDIEADIKRLGWDKGVGSGRFMPMDDFRNQIEIVTGEARNKARALPYLEGPTTNAMRSLSKVKTNIDNAQTFGDLRESGAGRSASMRYAFRNGLEQGEGRFNNANRFNAKGLKGFIQRQQLYDKALQGAYTFGGKLTPRNEDQLIARRALMLDQSKGGEWGRTAQNILAMGGREAPIIKRDYDEKSPTQKAWDNIENFIASIEAAKQGEAK